MKNLIDEIEKLKVYECEFERRPLGIIFMKDCYIKEDLENTLNQYNIITAPKSIKLSEIVERLNEEFAIIHTLPDGRKIAGKEFKVERNCTYINGNFESLLSTNVNEYYYGNLIPVFKLSPNNKFIEISFDNKFKWLYTLWVAGTEIINDLEGDKDE